MPAAIDASAAAFAMMQLKAIFSILLRRYAFELAQPSESYANDVSKLVVAVKQPCKVRYRRRAAEVRQVEVTQAMAGDEPAASGCRIRVDLDLCQGHSVCLGEAPEVFGVERNEQGEDKVVLYVAEPPTALRAKVDAAVRHCPTRALSIESSKE